MNVFRTACLGKRYLIFCTHGKGWLRSFSVEFSQTRSLWNRLVRGGVVSSSRCFSKHSKNTPTSHDVDEDHPESTEILHKLRARHHYHQDKDVGKFHEVYVLEPDFKWGRNRFRTVTTEHRLDEACALVESIENWKVVGKSVESVRKQDGKRFFGKGKIEELTEKFQEMKKASDSPFDSVFIDVAQLNARQHKELEDLWDLKIFDRFGVVLQIFKERAKTAEAKLQVELAELPYIRTRLAHAGENDSGYDQQRGGTYTMGGSGETVLEKQKRVLSEREQKLKKKLQTIKKRREHVRHERQKKHVPTVAVVGYTNAGKTTLIKALTDEAKMHPEDKLFATLDVTAHPGKLPSGMMVLFIDTVGFVSDLPPELVESFSATLEDIADSDLVVHVRDISHPECESQLEDVMTVLEKQLSIKAPLIDNMIEAQNKTDLCDEKSLQERTGVLNNRRARISAVTKAGLNELRSMIEQGIISSTGRQIIKLVFPPDGPQLSWLYHETTVQETAADDEGNIVATVVMDEAAKKKYQAKFGRFD
ncbi:hypothetical protein OS493_034445 [Desmophyllum pertusum]|uniref:Hflx-type G domain-containing protein n=1 Tax=Desmophyllum pertusum TaxID=174260 RepID=A0A9W9Z720_9CNID|nr:hypothetical protein OS493_034445 [Desmophyllum pertusum]